MASSSALSAPPNPIRVCKKDADCVLVDSPKCVDDYNKIAVNKASKDKIAARISCKKSFYKFNDSDPGATMKAECFKSECRVKYSHK